MDNLWIIYGYYPIYVQNIWIFLRIQSPEDTHNPIMRLWFFNPRCSSCHNGIGSLGEDVWKIMENDETCMGKYGKSVGRELRNSRSLHKSIRSTTLQKERSNLRFCLTHHQLPCDSSVPVRLAISISVVRVSNGSSNKWLKWGTSLKQEAWYCRFRHQQLNYPLLI